VRVERTGTPGEFQVLLTGSLAGLEVDTAHG
jgi:hypothetical protein